MGQTEPMTDIAGVAVEHRTTARLEESLDHIRSSPRHRGTLELIVCRPEPEHRVVVDVGELNATEGLAGDCWNRKRSPKGEAPQLNKQLNLINARVSRAIAGDADADRALAGDQLHVDLDLSVEHLPPGTRLEIGTAVIEITADPHTGCAKFRRRFGAEALRFVNHGEGAELRMRGICARVAVAGTIRRGDVVTVVPVLAGAAS